MNREVELNILINEANEAYKKDGMPRDLLQYFRLKKSLNELVLANEIVTLIEEESES